MSDITYSYPNPTLLICPGLTSKTNQTKEESMKTQNFVAALLTTLLLCLGNLAIADVSDDMATEVPTVNVNEADAETLSYVLLGIGSTRAQNIVDYREKHGKFYSAEELTAVKGIGQSTV
jgi:competence ComEA-like helix-hairpin-helix protein